MITNAAIIDDESINRLVIKKMLEDYFPEINILFHEGSIRNATSKLNEQKPDLVFLDIEMKNGTGFDILEKLDYKPCVIFVTAYKNYAIQAIKSNAFDYLLKPINEVELIKAVTKFKNAYSIKSENADSTNFYSIPTKTGKVMLSTDDILYFESDGSYTKCFSKEGTVLISKNIGEIEKELIDKNFFRTHNKFLVNVNKIKKINLSRSSTLVLEDGTNVELSQRRKKDFLSTNSDKLE